MMNNGQRLFEQYMKQKSQSILKITKSCFDLSIDNPYKEWRQQKLATYPVRPSDLLVSIEDFANPHEQEIAQIHRVMRRYNMAIYDIHSDVAICAEQLLSFTRQFGLNRIDDNLCADEQSVSKLKVVANSQERAYIPYTNKAISWHTDGYYNPFAKTIRGFVLHCNHPAQQGGENQLLDPEILYILLRDINPNYIEVLMDSNVMTIPANIENNTEIRASQTGAVFSLDSNTACLHMRYTARNRSIKWKSDPMVEQAISTIREILENDHKYRIQHKLQAGQGLICNNVLHNRSAFQDGVDICHTREFLRARFYDRVNEQEQ